MLVLLCKRSFCVQKISTTTEGRTFGHNRFSSRYSWSVPYPETPAARILWLEIFVFNKALKRSSASASRPHTNESPKNNIVGLASRLNSSSRNPRLLCSAWTVRALVTTELEFGIGVHPSSES